MAAESPATVPSLLRNTVAVASVGAIVLSVAGLMSLLVAPEDLIRQTLASSATDGRRIVDASAAPPPADVIGRPAPTLVRDITDNAMGTLAPGDRLAIETAVGKRHLIVTSVKPASIAHPVSSVGGPRFLLVTCQPVDAEGRPTDGRLVRFMIEAEGVARTGPAPALVPQSPASAL